MPMRPWLCSRMRSTGAKMTEGTVQFFYWNDVLEAWVQCTADEYMREHYGKSFTKIMEVA